MRLNSLREELFSLAKRATMLFAMLRSLASLQPQYQFGLPYFLSLFDEALGGELPPEFLNIDAECKVMNSSGTLNDYIP